MGESADCFLVVLSSNETNEILDKQVLACELVPESVQRLSASPITIKAKPGETGLSEPATISVATLASIPRGCLTSLEGRLDPIPLRLAIERRSRFLSAMKAGPKPTSAVNTEKR